MAEDKTKPVEETITYEPGLQDPPSTRWGGHTFHANVPKKITGRPDGTEQERINHHIIERVRDGNPSFTAGDAKAPKKKKVELPTDANGYKAYMIGWLQDQFDSAEALIERFVRDRDLQITCEVGAEDFAYLGSLFLPKLSKLAKADDMSEGQIASAWLRHGVNQLPF